MSKIITRICGGLGNQMFIYAAAKSLSERLNIPLFVDSKSAYINYYYKHNFELDIYNINFNNANKLESINFRFGRYVRFLIRKFPFLLNPFGIKYIFEDHINNNILDVSDRNKILLLEGYWQNEVFFKDVSEILKKEFTFKIDISEQSRKLAEKIQSKKNSVCIHARRLYGQPASDNVLPSNNGIDVSYYLNSIDKIKNSLSDVHFYCFSDYPQWFKENLPLDENYTIVDLHNYSDDNTFEDFWLMTQCKHFIISNSTFSWWAAWLSERENTIIIAPGNQYWSSKNIVPERWISSIN
jgi:hypothetical protein